MSTAEFFMKIAGDEETAREVVAASLGMSLEEFLAGLKAAEGEPDEH